MLLKSLKPMQTKRLLAALAAAMLMAGCSTFDAVQKQVSEDQKTATKLRERMDDDRRTGAVERHAGQRLIGQEIEIVSKAQEPDWLKKPYSYATSDQGLEEILVEISQDIGVPIQIKQSQSGAASLAPQQAGAAHTPSLLVRWRGDLKGLLNYLALRSGLYWKYDGGRILFFKEDTRSFHVFLPGTKSSVTSSIALSGTSGGSGGASASSGGTNASSGGGGGGGSGSSVSVTSTQEIDAYDSVRQSIESILADSPQGGGAGPMPAGARTQAGAASGRVVINSALGMITVTASPPYLDRIAEYVKGVNERFARNVNINVKIYNVSLRREANLGIQYSALLDQLSGKYKLTVTGTPPLAPSAGTPGQVILERTSTNPNRSSTLLLQALEQYGDVALQTSGQVIAANGQPSPLQVGDEITYLASSATTTAVNAGTTTTLTPGKQAVGFTANFLPKILGDNRILLEYQITLSSLSGLDQVTSNGSMIQTPRVATQSLQQKAFVKDGQSIVLFGFETNRSEAQRALGITGGGANATGNRQMIVIVMEVFSGNA